ncbi:ATP-dependent Clp protease ATP-binding subunit [Clostridium oryzae]|uniref:ATP-dependent Clp protease ATP-binding subunit ClpC n=1 Tax=Clostridium oryzae TaxID=1450648 RepID=A0A1V4IUC7_9CLOT|nr:ATP-dependent Clp protease ATP-binding subunit [Clostridium oryzae]OPJ63047.1 ATP-dependent Clp protease ATP-binding subunit ClpC [Clostridium oryzae]
MKKCSICHKNIAVIFTTKIEDGKTESQGICLECAKKMGLPVVDQLMQQSGISPEELENLSEQMNSMIQDGDMEDIINNSMMNIFNDSSTPEKDSGKEEIKSLEKESNPTQNFNFNDFTEKKAKHDKQRTKRKNLDKFGINLTKKAQEGKVDKVIGRNREIDRVIQILNRRMKNNPMLIGEPGVGKTAIAEGLAVRISEKQVPEKLFDAEVYLLDLTAVVAGTQFRGQFEGRMKAIIDEAKELGNVILVIDEVHNIIGAGEAQGGALNAANILKPALARGEIQIIGATTLDEYRKYIEKDSALERRFQPIIVEEPSIGDSIEILKGIKSYYEDYHKVRIEDEVIDAAVNLSARYITDRYLPDKAIDVIDEASSRANLKNKGLVELKSLREELTEVEKKIKDVAEENNFEKAAAYKVEQCRIEDRIRTIESESLEVALTVDDIAYVIEAWTKIPVQKVTEDEAKRLLNLETRLHTRVIGQDEAVTNLSKAIRRNRLGFRKKKKPSSFIFVGPTGVGKTELARALSSEMFGTEDALIRMDMSEYMEKHTVSKLIGAPPGYVGYDEGGQLTEKVRRKPYSVILLDEIEKAHPDVFNMLLQILEDGRLTDNQGRTVYFENTVIIMTSNAGTNFKSYGIGFAQEGYDEVESGVKEALKETFKPEFLNRVDDIIIFKKLDKDQLYKIIDLMLKEVADEVLNKNITIDFSEDVKKLILEKGYDSKYGARPLRRTIQKYIEDSITDAFLTNKIGSGDHVLLELQEGKVEVKKL